jgi:hypothetical protein
MKHKVVAVVFGAWVMVAPFASSHAQVAQVAQVAQAARPAAAAPHATPIEGVSVLQAEGTVQAVDRATRAVTVNDAAGGQATFTVGEDSKNLAQLKPGDRVRVRMVREAFISMSTGNAPAAGSVHPGSSVAGAGGVAGTVVSAAEVVTVDQKSGVLALTSPDGRVFHVQVQDPVKIARLSPSTRVDVAYSAKVSVSVVNAQ